MKLLSPAIKVATAFTMGGAASALANLLLARHLSTVAFGEFSLVLTIATLSVVLGPISLDDMVLRNRPGPRPSLLRESLFTGGIAGVLIASISGFLYTIDTRLLVFIAITIAAASVARVGASVYQSERRFTWSLWLVQSQNLTLVLVAVAAGFFSGVTAATIFSVYALHWVIAAVVGWVSLRMYSGLPIKPAWKSSWGERAPLFGHTMTLQLFATLDRLMIPALLSIESLATFSVLMVLVLSPFKMFEISVSYALIPALRGADAATDRAAILIHEGKTAAAVILLAIVSAFLLAPWVKDLMLGDKYDLPMQLIMAAVFSGTVKVGAAFLASIVTALGDERQLVQLNRASWSSLLLAVGGAWLGSQWGLTGLVWGFAGGAVLRLLVAGLIARRLV